ncbi:hypothetical protein [Maridesulfovibrio sp.]|uniref:hypothetical protein n=1 Tax=Maridesulfovibrio sp. TaxID=2795000 RepID=UPI0029C9F8E6|nr:hypothetical protein [Maridesulfovibrio sp.]
MVVAIVLSTIFPALLYTLIITICYSFIFSLKTLPYFMPILVLIWSMFGIYVIKTTHLNTRANTIDKTVYAKRGSIFNRFKTFFSCSATFLASCWYWPSFIIGQSMTPNLKISGHVKNNMATFAQLAARSYIIYLAMLMISGFTFVALKYNLPLYRPDILIGINITITILWLLNSVLNPIENSTRFFSTPKAAYIKLLMFYTTTIITLSFHIATYRIIHNMPRQGFISSFIDLATPGTSNQVLKNFTENLIDSVNSLNITNIIHTPGLTEIAIIATFYIALVSKTKKLLFTPSTFNRSKEELESYCHLLLNSNELAEAKKSCALLPQKHYLRNKLELKQNIVAYKFKKALLLLSSSYSTTEVRLREKFGIRGCYLLLTNEVMEMRNDTISLRFIYWLFQQPDRHIRDIISAINIYDSTSEQDEIATVLKLLIQLCNKRKAPLSEIEQKDFYLINEVLKVSNWPFEELNFLEVEELDRIFLFATAYYLCLCEFKSLYLTASANTFEKFDPFSFVNFDQAQYSIPKKFINDAKKLHTADKYLFASISPLFESQYAKLGLTEDFSQTLRNEAIHEIYSILGQESEMAVNLINEIFKNLARE